MKTRRIVSYVCVTVFAFASRLLAGDTLVADGAKVEKLGRGMKFTEGPVWLPEREILVFSDIPNSKLMQWSEKDGLAVFDPSEKANGNVLDTEGRIVSCQHAGRNVVRRDSEGKVTVLAKSFEGKRFNSPNDAAVRSDGTIWFTDPSWGLEGKREIPGHWVFKLDPKTQKIEVLIKDLPMPNGIVFSPDESRVYVADTGGNKKHPDPEFHKLPARIRCYAVSEQGELGDLLFEIPQGSDGMAVDVKGNLYTTAGNAIVVYNADGKKLEQITFPERPANVCFGGKNFKALFVTARTSLYRISMNIAGAKMPTK